MHALFLEYFAGIETAAKKKRKELESRNNRQVQFIHQSFSLRRKIQAEVKIAPWYQLFKQELENHSINPTNFFLSGGFIKKKEELHQFSPIVLDRHYPHTLGNLKFSVWVNMAAEDLFCYLLSGINRMGLRFLYFEGL